MKKPFTFNKKQERALARLEKCLKSLEKAGVSLVYDEEDHDLKAVAMTPTEESKVKFAGYCTNLPDGCKDVTEEFLDSLRDVDATMYVIDKYLAVGIEEKTNKRFIMNKLNELNKTLYDTVGAIATEATRLVKKNGGFVLTQGADDITAIYLDWNVEEQREGVIEALMVETIKNEDGTESDMLFAFISPYKDHTCYDEAFIKEEFAKDDSKYVYALNYSSDVYMAPTMAQIAYLLEEYLDTDTNTDDLLLPGVFTVNGNGKKIRFAKGNLFWSGSEFTLEENQLAYPTSWDANHVGHFYWSKDAAVAHAEKYNDSERTSADSFFAADSRAIEGLTVLTKDEWRYLFENSLHSHNGNFCIIVDGKKGAILKPDGFSGAIKDTYTLKEWAAAEAEGLVFLPFAGYRNGTCVDKIADIDGVTLWSCTPTEYYDEDLAGYAGIGKYGGYVGYGGCRSHGYSVRLVGLVQ